MTTRTDLFVNAVELLRQPGLQRRVDVAVPLVAIDALDPRLAGDVGVDITVESTPDDVVVAGRLTVAWSDECRRCLRPLAEELVVEVEERYAEHDPSGERAVDPDVFPIAHGQIDLAPMVREEVLLAIPDAPLCRPDCAGLCPTCGADRNADPCGCDTAVRDERWAALDQLRLEDRGPHPSVEGAESRPPTLR
jgi:uncharacterized protein